MLLTRDEFREGVFARDNHKCVICGVPAKDAHHIIERRLFPDGGYYLDNGASLCAAHHIEAEQTTLACDDIRRAAGITRVVLPPHLYDDQPYDKWGNPILPNGTRLKGDLFNDASVQKILLAGGVLSLFSKYVKYPRTYHFPFSPGVSKDDRVMDASYGRLPTGEVVITEKMDGENTTLYNDYMHARSLEYEGHESRARVKALWASICYNIPEGWRVCGENLYARHSIAYTALPSFLMMFSIWDEENRCLSWEDTRVWAELLGLSLVPELYRGPFDPEAVKALAESVVARGGEGIVCRLTRAFPYSSFRECVGKYVRKGHVQTHGHWMRQRVTPNKLREADDGNGREDLSLL